MERLRSKSDRQWKQKLNGVKNEEAKVLFCKL